MVAIVARFWAQLAAMMQKTSMVTMDILDMGKLLLI
jgi:hypothetical protein